MLEELLHGEVVDLIEDAKKTQSAGLGDIDQAAAKRQVLKVWLFLNWC